MRELVIACVMIALSAFSLPAQETGPSDIGESIRYVRSNEDVAEIINRTAEYLRKQDDIAVAYEKCVCEKPSLLELGKLEKKPFLQMFIDGGFEIDEFEWNRRSSYPGPNYTSKKVAETDASKRFQHLKQWLEFMKRIERYAATRGQNLHLLNKKFPNGYSPREYVDEVRKKSTNWDHVEHLIHAGIAIETANLPTIQRTTLKTDLGFNGNLRGVRKLLQEYGGPQGILQKAKGGDSTAQFVLGMLYVLNVPGVEQNDWMKLEKEFPEYASIAGTYNHIEAAKWLGRCSNLADCKYELSFLYKECPQKYELLEGAAKQGHPYAAEFLAKCYLGMISSSVAPDEKKAMDLLVRLGTPFDTTLQEKLAAHLKETGGYDRRAMELFLRSGSANGHKELFHHYAKQGDITRAFDHFIVYWHARYFSISGKIDTDVWPEVYGIISRHKIKDSLLWLTELALTYLSYANFSCEIYCRDKDAYPKLMFARLLLEGNELPQEIRYFYRYHYNMDRGLLNGLYGDRFRYWRMCKNGDLKGEPCDWHWPGHLDEYLEWLRSGIYLIGFKKVPLDYAPTDELLCLHLIYQSLGCDNDSSEFHRYGWMKLLQAKERGNPYARYYHHILSQRYLLGTCEQKKVDEVQYYDKVLKSAPLLPWEK